MSDFVPRRRVLAASAAALPFLLGIAGCRSSDAFAGPDPLAGRPPLGRDVLTLQAVIAAEENMIDLYRTAISGAPGNRTAPQTRMLQSLQAQHEQHLVQLKARLVVPPGASASPSPSSPSGAAASSSPRASTLSLAELRAAERASAAGLVQRLVAVPPALAQLFASIAASDATHVTALGG